MHERPSFRSKGIRVLAEGEGFEPTEAINLTAFRERHLQPLGHLSTYSIVAVTYDGLASVHWPDMHLIQRL